MTVKALQDGLASGETEANDFIANEMFSGAAPAYFTSVVASGSFYGRVAATQLVSAGSIASADAVILETAGSPYKKGIVYNFTCAGAITGGQLAMVSGGIAVAAVANGVATGVAYGTTNYTSGTTATIPIVVFGPAYLNACADIGDGTTAVTGSVAHMVQSGAIGLTSVGRCLKGAASGTTSLALVFVGKL